MFGYIKLEADKKSNEAALAQTFMCGLCLSTKKIFGNRARNYVGHDINFFNVLLHSYADEVVSINNAKCLSSPFKKRSMIAQSDLTDALAIANILLCYANLQDKCRDRDSIKAYFALKFLKRAYNKAKKLNGEMDRQIQSLCAQLAEEEEKNSDNIDRVCDCFARLSQTVVMLCKPNANALLYDLAYNMGKWVYLIDALDDLEKDFKKNNYNVLICYFGKQNFTDKQNFLQKNQQELQFLFYTVLNSIAVCYNDLNLTKYTCVLTNIIYLAIRQKTKQLLEGKKCERDIAKSTGKKCKNCAARGRAEQEEGQDNNAEQEGQGQDNNAEQTGQSKGEKGEE